MCTDDIETRYCQYVEDVFNHHRVDRLADYMAADVVSHFARTTSGIAAAQLLVASLLEAFPDLHLTIDALATMDSQLLARLTASGTHSSGFLGLPATGRRFRVKVFGAWHVRNGRCAEHWLQLDLLELFEQLGAELTSISLLEKTGRRHPEV